MRRRPTMKDVAALAGVSLSTVSRVVNRDSRVDPAMALQVDRAAATLGYRRDHAASALRRADRQSATLAVIVEDVSNPFFAQVLRGVEEVAGQHAMVTFAASSEQRADAEREIVSAFTARGVDGLIMAAVPGDQAYLGAEREAGLQVVFVDRPATGFEADAAVSTNADGARAAVDHLVAHGHRRIAFLGDAATLWTARERMRGFREALVDHGIAPEPALVVMDVRGAEAAREVVHRLMRAALPPTAILAGQNLITIGTMLALRDLGAADRVALVGYDGTELADLLQPGLTTVEQDPVELGRVATRLLLERLRGQRGPYAVRELPTVLRPRGSGEIRPVSEASR